MYEKSVPRVLTDLRHGGHALADDLFKKDPDAAALAGASPVDDVIRAAAPADVTQISTPFGYLLTDLRDRFPAAHLPADDPPAVVAALKALGSAMAEQQPADQPGNSPIPPVYTYLGQFIDHDITANTDRNTDISIIGPAPGPLTPDEVVSVLHNLREPALNLDSLYGDGPDAPDTGDNVPYDGIRFRIGKVVVLPVGPPGAVVPGDDLPRKAPAAPNTPGKARIGDARNDENLIVAQLHLAFLKFHNTVVDWVRQNDPQPDDAATFARAQQLVRWHYQFVAVEDFLRTIARPEVVDAVLAGTDVTFAPADDAVFMPLEHSVAAYRFGHSMVRAGYDWNENFGDPAGNPDNVQPFARFDQMFQFTGNGDMAGQKALPSNWPARYERLTDPASPFPGRFARKIDTHLAPPLFAMTNESRAHPEMPLPIKRIVERLAVRNLMRGYRLAIPTGQNVARALGLPVLSEAELLSGPQVVRDALIDGGFVDNTPLWFYVLKEAEVQQQGNRLGDVGSRIVVETIVGQVRSDPASYLRRPGGAWSPAEGVTLPGGGEVRTIKDILVFAGVHP